MPWPRRPRRRPGRPYYGWVIVGVLALTETISFGVLAYGFAVFLVPMQHELGWSPTAITGAYSLAVVVSGLAAIPMGWWLDRHGARALMTLGSGGATALVLAWSQVEDLTAFYAIWAGIGLVMAAVLYEPAFAVIATWFARARHQALAVLTVVAGFASVVFTPLAGWLVEVQGWRGALVTLAAILGTLTIPPHALVLRRRPEDLGLRPDGAAADPPPPATDATPLAAGSPLTDDTLTRSVAVRVALRDPGFWWLTAALFLATLAATAISVHLVTYLRERGYSASVAATWAGLIGLGAVLGRVAVTVAGRRLPLPLVTAAMFALQALAVLVLVGWRRPAGVAAFVVLFGLGVGLVSLARAALIADFYGRASYATISGVLALLLTAARALAPVGASTLRTRLDSYAPVMGTVAVASTLAAAMMLLAHRTQQQATTGPLTIEPRSIGTRGELCDRLDPDTGVTNRSAVVHDTRRAPII
jgi:sugar phosphate permease